MKITCTRCGGSGSYSFNMLHGSRCYGCNGTGFTTVDAAKHAKAQAAKAKREAKKQAEMQQRMIIAAQVAAELDVQFGPFPKTELGSYERMVACQKAFGKTPGDIVTERLSAVMA